MKKIIALLVAFLTVAFALCSCSKPGIDTGDDTTAADTTAAAALTYEEAKDIIVASTDSYKVTLPVATYFFNSVYQSILSYYSSYLSILGLDTTKSLKEQSYGDDTWFNYILSMTKSQMEDVILFSEYANELGYTIDESDQASIDDLIASAESYAEENGATTEEVIASAYGACVNSDVLRECLKIQILADKGFAKFESDLNYSDEDYESYYSEHIDEFLVADCRSYTFSVTIGEDVTDDEKAALLAEAKEKADTLAASESDEAFAAGLRAYLLADGTATEDTVDSYVASTLSKSVALSTLSSLGFNAQSAEDYKVGLSSVVEGTNAYTVNYIVSAPARNEEKLRSVRHILLTVGEDEDSSFTNFDDATARAKEILAEYEAGEKTADAFGELANNYSDDPGSNTTGGIYEGITSSSSYVEPFLSWTVDPERKVGDTGLVNTDYGVHIMYFDSEDEMSVWQTSAKEALEKADYDKTLDDLGAKYGYSVDDEAMNKIDA